MGEDEKELMESFEELLPENQAYALAYIRRVHIFQKNTQKDHYEEFGVIPEARGRYGRIPVSDSPNNYLHRKIL